MDTAMGLEELLQERLVRLEAGESLDACLVGLPDDEADLLRLGVSLGEVQHPPRDSGVVAAQRAELLKRAARSGGMKDQARIEAGKPPARPGPNRLRMLVAFSGVAAVLCVCTLVAALGTGFAWWAHRGQVARRTSPTLAPEASLAPGATPESAPESARTVVPPTSSGPEVPDPRSAVLADARGLVEVQSDGGTWATVSAGHTLVGGQRIRTGGLSSARLLFYDDSQVTLGPRTEVSVDVLDAPLTGEPRAVVLTQWTGETEHDVVPAGDAGARYEVRTPSAAGAAKGTAFRVRITPDLLTHFDVDEGSIAVTGLDVTVVAIAGQSVAVDRGQAPGEPVFRITGEGRVTQIGPVWTIAGRDFATHDGTVIVGNPQVGDWVLVEGHLLPDDTRVADLIVLLRRSPANRFTITGRVDEIGDTAWTVAGQPIAVDAVTVVDDGIEVEDLVCVEGVILPAGTLLAEHIHRVEDRPGLPFDFVGVVQDITDETWTISGVTITVDGDTEIEEGLASGDIVQVRGWILDDGTWLATSIERAEDEEREFELTGYVESTAPWVVAGISFETSEWTEIEEGIRVGDRVRVTGRILEDGTRLAAEIERVDDDEAVTVEFVGRVTSVDPWVVGGISLVVDDGTVVDEDVGVGDLVKVEARILPDGTWLATRISPVHADDLGLGCVSIVTVVVRVDADQIELLNGQTISIDDDVVVVGEIAANSIVVIVVCIDADGTVHVVTIIVIYQPAPTSPTPTAVSPLPTPTVPPPSPGPSPSPPPDEGGDKVTICHKPNSKHPHTITISRSALPAHLAHGDTIGPCP